MTWLNQQIADSSVRATVISIFGQADAIGQTAGGPVLGVIGNVFGIRAALVRLEPCSSARRGALRARHAARR